MKDYSFKEIIKLIDNDKYVLPVWQREYVWTTRQIEYLFDSMYNGYPIGPFMLWDVKNNDSKIFYKFVNQVRFDKRKPLDYNDGDNELPNSRVHAILDGQQRLTSIYLCLANKSKIYNVRKNDDDEILLYIDLDEKNEKIFKLDRKELKNEYEKRGLLSVKDIFRYRNKYFNNICKSNKLPKKKYIKKYNKIISMFDEYKIFSIPIVNSDAKTALEIFNRINTKMTPLRPADIVFSVLIYNEKNLRKKINKNLKIINGGGKEKNFNFNVDFILKVLMCIENTDAKYKIENIENIESTKKNKLISDIIKSLKTVKDVLLSYGMDKNTIISYNAIVPMVYYCYKKNNKLSDVEKEAMIKFVQISILKGVFSSSGDTKINEIRKVIYDIVENKEKLSFKQVKRMNISNISYKIDNKEIKSWLKNYKYGSQFANVVLRILFNGPKFQNGNFDVDHLHPQMQFNNAKNKKPMDLIPNLQVLRDDYNRKYKHGNPLTVWLEQNPKYKTKEYYIPIGCSTEFSCRNEFFRERKKLMIKALIKYFK